MAKRSLIFPLVSADDKDDGGKKNRNEIQRTESHLLLSSKEEHFTVYPTSSLYYFNQITQCLYPPSPPCVKLAERYRPSAFAAIQYSRLYYRSSYGIKLSVKVIAWEYWETLNGSGIGSEIPTAAMFRCMAVRSMKQSGQSPALVGM